MFKWSQNLDSTTDIKHIHKNAHTKHKHSSMPEKPPAEQQNISEMDTGTTNMSSAGSCTHLVCVVFDMVFSRFFLLTYIIR